MSAKPTDGTKTKSVPTAPTAMQQWFPIGSWLPNYNWGKFLAAMVVTVVLMLVAKRALKADDRDLLSRRLAQRIMTRHGTRFTGANLTRANFADTRLVEADLSNSVLDGANWDAGKGPLVIDSA